MTTEETNSWVRRIIALLATAEHPATNEEEAATAAAMAARLMMKLNIERSALEQAGKAAKEEYKKDDLGALDTSWNAYLAQAVAKANFCQTITLTKSGGPTYSRIAIVGQPSNIEVVKYIYAYLLREIRRLGRETFRAATAGGYATTTEWKWIRAFGHGAANAIAEKLAVQRKEDEREQAGSMELVVVKDADLTEAYKRIFPKATSGAKLLPVDSMAYGSGYAAGKKLETPAPGISKPTAKATKTIEKPTR